jgi:hypothetical protein
MGRTTKLVIPTTSAAVSVGMTANVPRVDYSGGGCPKLLLEPQRTNDLQFSEQLDNAFWTKSGTTITANDAIAPDGTMSADKITLTSGSGRIARGVTLTDNVNYTASVFVKNIDATNATIRVRCTNKAGTVATANFILTGSGTISELSDATATITAFANNWYRCTLSFNAESGATTPDLRIISNATGGLASGESVYGWGAQLEAGSYVSSYIPTLSAASTRGQDACSKTGISSLIGQTEGTLFAEIDLTKVGGARFLSLNNGLTSERILLAMNSNNSLSFLVVNSGSTQANLTTTVLSLGTHKVAAAYNLDDFVLYVDGVQIQSDNSGTVPTCSDINIGHELNGNQFGDGISQAILFPTRLTNTELADLTTI